MKLFNDPEVFARVLRLPPYAFSVTDRLRDAAVARGVDVVDLSIANPDGEAPPAVTEALRAAAGEARYHRYQDPRGIPALREAAAAWYRRRHGVVLDPEREVLTTSGTKEGIGHAMLALLQEREAVLAPSPSHPIHAHAAVLAGGETIPVPGHVRLALVADEARIRAAAARVGTFLEKVAAEPRAAHAPLPRTGDRA